MNRVDKLNMIGYIISLLVSDRFDSTVNTLAEQCHVPVAKMRKYLSEIFKDNRFRQFMCDEDSAGNIDVGTSVKTLFEEAEDTTFIERILSGEADDEPIYGEMLCDALSYEDIYRAPYKYLVPITAFQASAISDKFPEMLGGDDNNRMFETKDAIYKVSKEIAEMKNDIEDTISQHQKISFVYNESSSNTTIECTPVVIIQIEHTNLFYIKNKDGNMYRLDRIVPQLNTNGDKYYIKPICEEADADAYKPDPDEKYYWGAGYRDHGKPVHIKLRVSTLGDTEAKFRSDVASRQTEPKMYYEGDYLIYEDDVIGTDELRKWMRSYGTDIKVLEPQSLIDDVVAGVKRTLSLYDKFATE